MRCAGIRRGLRLACGVAVVAACTGAPARAAQPPQPPAGADPALLEVIFREGSGVRLREGALTDGGAGSLAQDEAILTLAARQGEWQRAHVATEAELDALRAKAAARGAAAPDLNLSYRLRVTNRADAPALLDSLRAARAVAYAGYAPLPAPAPTAPNFENDQLYLNAATTGLGAKPAWLRAGGDGSLVRIADIEYSWNTNHLDLPLLTALGPAGVDPFNSTDHGTSVLGEILSKRNGAGTTGGAYAAAGYIVAVNTASGYNIPSAITLALGALGPGDVLLIEQQTFGPNYTGVPPGTQVGYVPVEWNKPVYDAIVTAVGMGVAVVEPAGNGSQNLNSSVYTTGNGGHFPFLAANDSGAILVGGGGSIFAGSGDRARVAASNYGTTVDVQGWADSVVTTGGGGAYNAEGPNLYYTISFGGTSAAAAMVAGACAQAQSAYKAARSAVLTPSQLKEFLRSTGSPQTSGAFPDTQNIGPRPNVEAAIVAALACAPPMINQQPTPASVPPGAPAMLHVGASGSNVTYRWRRDGAPLNDGGEITGVFTDTLQIASVTPPTYGVYTVVVSTGCGVVVSDGALVRAVGCPGDANFDGAVDFLDLNIVLGQYGQTGAGLEADLNDDGVVDFLDLNIVLSAFGGTC